MKEKKQKKKEKIQIKNIAKIYKCEKCGYENKKTYLFIFGDEEYRFCLKCTRDFFKKNLPGVKIK